MLLVLLLLLVESILYSESRDASNSGAVNAHKKFSCNICAWMTRYMRTIVHACIQTESALEMSTMHIMTNIASQQTNDCITIISIV
jgi:hypothetical protein